jgi:hypothetical protein
VDRAWALPAAVGVLAIENVALLAALLFSGRAPTGVEVSLLIKFPLCIGLLQRRAGAFLALTLWESLLVVLGLVNPALSPIARMGVLAGGVAGLTLLGLSLSLFPVRVPER